MKYINFIPLIIIISCKPYKEDNRGFIHENTHIITVDSCEYIVWNGHRNGGIIHKANCKNHNLHNAQ